MSSSSIAMHILLEAQLFIYGGTLLTPSVACYPAVCWHHMESG